MASYDDGYSLNFWVGMRKEPESKQPEYFQANKNHFGNPDSDDRQWQNYGATKAMVNEAQRQLREIHALKYIPDLTMLHI